MDATLYSDPGCPWAYCEIPALRVIEWRYGEQLDWRLVLIGLTESAEQYVARGYTPLRGALGQLRFRRYSMPFSPQPKQRVAATARACRAIVSARILEPGSEWRVLRALQLANFNTPLLLDDDDQLAEVLRAVPGVDADAVVSRLDDPIVSAAYEDDKAEARAAAGSAAELQGKTATTDGPVRYTAPSLALFNGENGFMAGGFQPVEAYDVLIANLDPTLRRESPPETPAPLLDRFPEGLTTQEVGALMTRGNDVPDRIAAEEALITLVSEGRAAREPLGQDAIWRAHRDGRPTAQVGIPSSAAA
jgi:2-hydroxychromene-2-carboxylate isomerase